MPAIGFQSTIDRPAVRQPGSAADANHEDDADANQQQPNLYTIKSF